MISIKNEENNWPHIVICGVEFEANDNAHNALEIAEQIIAESFVEEA